MQTIATNTWSWIISVIKIITLYLLVPWLPLLLLLLLLFIRYAFDSWLTPLFDFLFCHFVILFCIHAMVTAIKIIVCMESFFYSNLFLVYSAFINFKRLERNFVFYCCCYFYDIFFITHKQYRISISYYM